ncbi:hypothetical protein [Coleofasciculus sp.]|uniref:hypothetical protein n=1 Tax=Coleofasciculus sp. TaxID=3100458 RepID=UPI0039F7BEA7
MAASLLLSVLLLFTSSVKPAFALIGDPGPYPYGDIEAIIANVPTGDRWLQHMEEELLPFENFDLYSLGWYTYQVERIQDWNK